MSYALEDGIDAPGIPKRGRPRKYPFPGMTIGQSFVVPASDAVSCRVSCSAWKRLNPGWQFATREESAGRIRVWRVA